MTVVGGGVTWSIFITVGESILIAGFGEVETSFSTEGDESGDPSKSPGMSTVTELSS